MKSFAFEQNNISKTTIDNNGWLFKFGFKGRFGFFSLKTPIMKEVTQSKGPAVRYQRHRVYGIGIINSNREFSGFAFFDPLTRILIFAVLLFGVFYVSFNIFAAVISASTFYFLILFLSIDEDETLLNRCKSMFETKY